MGPRAYQRFPLIALPDPLKPALATFGARNCGSENVYPTSCAGGFTPGFANMAVNKGTVDALSNRQHMAPKTLRLATELLLALGASFHC